MSIYQHLSEFWSEGMKTDYKIDDMEKLLEEIDKDSIKAMEMLDKLIEYLRRNKPYIPCYAVRKELGLCNSSAIG